MLILGSVLVGFAAAAFMLVCLFMILVILVQKPRGGGLSGAFGGGGGNTQAVFGAKVGDALTKFTVGCFVVYLLLALALTVWTRPDLDAAVVPEVAPATTSEPGAVGTPIDAAGTPAPGEAPAENPATVPGAGDQP